MRPCGPPLPRLSSANLAIAETALNPRMKKGVTSIAYITSFISRASIFLPRYSGVRPTISPAMKMAMIETTSMS